MQNRETHQFYDSETRLKQKKTHKWFQDCGIKVVPLAETQLGVIRSIAFEEENVKGETENGDIRFSSKGSSLDRAYMDAVNSGDMETAQRMVDEADQYFTPSVLLHNPPSSIKGKIFLCQFILKDEEKVRPIGRTFSFLF